MCVCSPRLFASGVQQHIGWHHSSWILESATPCALPPQTAPASGKGQLQLQLSQPSGSQSSEQQQQPVAPKSGIAALLGPARPTKGETAPCACWMRARRCGIAKPLMPLLLVLLVGASIGQSCNFGTAGAAAAAAAAAGAAAATAGPPAATITSGELWTTKHAPQSEVELVVHKKKVQELRAWLEWQQESLGRPGVSRVAVVSGGHRRAGGWCEMGGCQAQLAGCMHCWLHRAACGGICSRRADEAKPILLVLLPAPPPPLPASLLRRRPAGLRQVHGAARPGRRSGFRALRVAAPHAHALE